MMQLASCCPAPVPRQCPFTQLLEDWGTGATTQGLPGAAARPAAQCRGPVRYIAQRFACNVRALPLEVHVGNKGIRAYPSMTHGCVIANHVSCFYYIPCTAWATLLPAAATTSRAPPTTCWRSRAASQAPSGWWRARSTRRAPCRTWAWTRKRCRCARVCQRCVSSWGAPGALVTAVMCSCARPPPPPLPFLPVVLVCRWGATPPCCPPSPASAPSRRARWSP